MVALCNLILGPMSVQLACSFSPWSPASLSAQTAAVEGLDSKTRGQSRLLPIDLYSFLWRRWEVSNSWYGGWKKTQSHWEDTKVLSQRAGLSSCLQSRVPVGYHEHHCLYVLSVPILKSKRQKSVSPALDLHALCQCRPWAAQRGNQK